MSFTLTWSKDLELKVARAASRHPDFKPQAAKAKALVEAEVARMYGSGLQDPTGEFAKSIKAKTSKTRRGVMDYHVYSDDPGAMSVEFGRMTKKGTWQPGQFVFSRALSRIRAGG